MAVLLTVTLLGIISAGEELSAQHGVVLLSKLVVGGLIGVVVCWPGAAVVNRLKLSTSGLYPMVVLGLGLFAFGVSEWLGGNGFLSAYIGGLVLGNRLEKGRESIMKFHDGLSWLMQILIFVMLGLLVFPSQLLPVAGVSLALAFFLMFVARPLAVCLCYLPFRPSKAELGYVSWVGMRGSVPIVLATFPATYGIEGAEQIFHLIFFVVFTSVTIQGLTLVSAAKFLKVTDENG